MNNTGDGGMVAEDSAYAEYQRTRRAHWDHAARQYSGSPGFGRHYQQQLARVYRRLVQPGLRVLELGCGRGDLLSALQPAYGVGVDLSDGMIGEATRRYPQLRFLAADAHESLVGEAFDVVVLSDLVNDVWDVQRVFAQIAKVSTSGTRVIMNVHSRLWQPILATAQSAGAAQRLLAQNWLTVDDIAGLLALEGFEVVRSWRELICPVQLPVLADFANRYLAKLWPTKFLSLTNFVVARPLLPEAQMKPAATVSIVVPARNEAGNVSRIFEETPMLGEHTELIFVEGHSTDNTYETIARHISTNTTKTARVFKQTGKGKGDAVRLGFSEARGDILMILDADLTVPPADLRRFHAALISGKGEFINGVRLVYPMEDRAMRFANLLGNKFFSLAFSWLLEQPIKDTLCGTKVLWRRDYEKIARNRHHFGDFDPFGDFDLLFGAAKLNMKIVEIPIRYRERLYGTTNIQRWRHGWILLKMVAFAARRIKFV